MNVSSSSYYSVENSTNNGFSGMISGLDTDSMVKEMLSGTQSKIDAQNALKQQALWKQEDYRDVITLINDFSSKYFDSSYGSSLTTNFTNPDFFNARTSSLSGDDALRIISTTDDALTGDLNVIVKELATAASLSGGKQVSSNSIISSSLSDTDKLTETFSKKVVLSIGGTEVSVNLNTLSTEQEMTDAFNAAFEAAGVNAEATTYEGKLRILTQPGQSVTVSSDSTAGGLALTGLSGATSSSAQDASGNAVTMFEGSHIDFDEHFSIDLSLDGVNKTLVLDNIEADADGTITAQSIADALSEKVGSAFGDYVKVELNADNTLEFSVNIMNGSEVEAGHEILITGADANHLGITPGSSTQVNTNTKLSELGLSGDVFSFTINGEQFTFSGDDSVGSMMRTINASDAGVTMTFSSISDTFKLEASSTGAQFGIEMSQQTGDLLTKMFGSTAINNSDKAISSQLTVGKIEGSGLASNYETSENASLVMYVDGEKYTFKLGEPEEGESHTKAQIDLAFNTWLEATFKDESDNPTIQYQDGNLIIKDGSVVSFEQTTVDVNSASAVEEGIKTDLALAMGFNKAATDNVATADTLVSDVVQLKDLAVTGTTLGDISEVGGQAVTFEDGRLSITGTGELSMDALSDLFGAESITFGDGSLGTDAVKVGSDAKISVNGAETSRSSNLVTVDGVTMQLLTVSENTGTDADPVYKASTITTSQDIDSIVETFEQFVEDYNEMIDKLNEYIGQEANYRDYAPLTADQKKEMSESEIELWEEKAKEGLLRNDSAINDFMSHIRSILYTTPEGSDIALYSIGIETTSNYKDNGKITLDTDALRTALSADPEAVKNLFTGENGIGLQLEAAIEAAASTSGANPGSIVQIAGYEDTTSANDNNIYRELQSIEDRIEQLQDRYELEKTRYWDQFTAMETILSDYTAQSSWLAQQFTTY